MTTITNLLIAYGIPYYCATCGKWWVNVRGNVSCCVLHPAGQCCHYADDPADAPKGKVALTDIDWTPGVQ